MFLMGMKLWSLVDGTRVKPSSDSVDLENMEKWNVDEAKAKYYIMSTINDEVMVNARVSSTAKDLWDSIAKTYGVAGEERVYQLYFNLMQCRMNGGTASEHVAKLKGILQQIVSTGEDLSDKFKIAMLLGSLTDEYNVKKQVLIEQKSLSFEDACSSIIGHVVGNSDTALSTFEKSKKGSGKRGKKGKGGSGGGPKKHCTHCNQDGHTVENCYEIHGYPANWKGKKKDIAKGKEVAMANMARESAEDGSSESVIILTAYILSATTDGRDPRDKWAIDSGASRFITPFLDILHEIHPIAPITIRVAGKGITLTATLAGTVYLENKFGTAVLTKVLYVKEATQNLLALKPLVRKGCAIDFDADGVRFYADKTRKRQIGFSSERISENQWLLEGTVAKRTEVANLANAETWHRRLGHPGTTRFQGAIKLYDQLSYISKDSADVSTRCIGCHVAKSKREPISKNPSPKPDHVMDVVHTDSWGPAPVETYGGHKYYVSFTDGCSGYTVIYLLKEHSSYEVFEKFQKYKALMENQTGRTIKVLRSDNGSEYKGPFTNRLEI